MDTFNYQLSGDTLIYPASIESGSPYKTFRPRNHESIFLVTEGEFLYEKDGERQILKKGQVGYISRGSADNSSAYMCDKVSFIAVNFAFDRENDILISTLPFDTVCSHGISYKYEKLFVDACDHFVTKTPGYMTLCNGIIMQIIGCLYNEYKMGNVMPDKVKRIEKAVEFIKNNFHDNELQISSLAGITNMSEKNFRRVFMNVYNKTPYAFLQEFRINKAEILLLHTPKSVSDIALQCGFSDVYSFSHCFKKHTGISPGKYRNL